MTIEEFKEIMSSGNGPFWVNWEDDEIELGGLFTREQIKAFAWALENTEWVI